MRDVREHGDACGSIRAARSRRGEAWRGAAATLAAAAVAVLAVLAPGVVRADPQSDDPSAPPSDAPRPTPAPPASANRSATALPALVVQIDKAKVDLKEHRLEVRLSRAASTITLHVVGDSGAVLADESHEFSGAPAGTPLVVAWTPTSAETVAKIELMAYDTSGYYAGVAIIPWSVRIPHEEVAFRTGSAQIDDSEKPKLEASFTKITEALAGHGDLGKITLFLAGHTDTVGSDASNFKLSQARAQAIAVWFKKRGLGVPIAYEGFGESSPAVRTADEVDEPKNRRVDYILSIDEPSFRTTGFRPSWKRAN